MSEDSERLSALGARAVRRVTSRGDVIEYARRALLPALEVEVVLREVSRAPLGLLEQTSLSLIEDGVDVHAYFNNDYEGNAIVDARTLEDLVGAAAHDATHV